MGNLTFYFNNDDSCEDFGNYKGFLNTPQNLLKADKFVDIPQAILESNIQQTVFQVMEVFNTDDQFAKQFEVDEIEFGLHIKSDGKVTIVAEDTAASTCTSIRIKLKRKRI